MSRSVVIPEIGTLEESARLTSVTESALVSFLVAIAYYAGATIGFALTLPAYLPVETYPVRVDDGVVKVEVP